MNKYRRPAAGFTLIELSIVLVIIALVIGAVLVGRDLIATAQLRKIVNDHAKITIAINAFNGKYGGLPGDLLKTRADQFGFSTCSDARCGNNDRRINDIYGNGAAQTLTRMEFEMPLFWRQLKESGLYDSSVDASAPILATIAAPNPMPTNNEQEVQRYVPRNPLGGVYLVGNNFGPTNVVRNGLLIGKTANLGTVLIGVPTSAQLTPLQAFYIDSKMDDGLPLTGTVFPYCNLFVAPTAESDNKMTPCSGAVSSGPTCVLSTTVVRYNAGGSSANSQVCELSLRLSELNN